jgi:hypothetical protein
VTKYDLFRRRIAPVAFALAIALIARDSCRKQDHDKATFMLDLGSARSAVQAIDAELWVGNDQVAVFHRNALAGGGIGNVRFESMMPAEDGELRIDVDLGTKHQHLVRHVHAADGASVTVPLGNELRP